MKHDNLNVGFKVKIKIPYSYRLTKLSDYKGGNLHVQLKDGACGVISQRHEEWDVPFKKARTGIVSFYTIKIPYYENENCTMCTYVTVEPCDIIEVL